MTKKQLRQQNKNIFDMIALVILVQYLQYYVRYFTALFHLMKFYVIYLITSYYVHIRFVWATEKLLILFKLINLYEIEFACLSFGALTTTLLFDPRTFSSCDF